MSRVITAFSLMFLLTLLIAVAHPAYAHDLQYEVSRERAVVVKLFFADNMDFSYESYEIFRPNESIPFQTGRTDALGRLSLLPDQEGTWRLKLFSESGHGLDFTLDIGKEGVLEDVEKPLYSKYLKVITGVGIIFGIFGIMKLFLKRRKK